MNDIATTIPRPTPLASVEIVVFASEIRFDEKSRVCAGSNALVHCDSAWRISFMNNTSGIALDSLSGIDNGDPANVS